MDWWTETRFALASFLEQHGLLAAFVVLLIEEAGVPVPVPGDFLMLVVGVQTRLGRIPFWQAILVMEVATILGSGLLYTVARAGGRGLVYRYGRFIRLSPERLDQAERWLNQHGVWAIIAGRLVPGLRIATTVACGVFAVPRRVFFPALAVGALLYILLYTLLGYFIGPPVVALLEGLHLPVSLIGSLVVLVILVVWTLRTRAALGGATLGQLRRTDDRGLRLRAGALAGVIATIGSTLLMNALINLAGNIAFQAPGMFVDRAAARIAFLLARELQPLLLIVAVPAFLAVGVAWGAVYGGWIEPRLRLWDWVNGMLFAIVPLGVSLLIIEPMLGLGFAAADNVAPQLAAVGEAIRHAAYGCMLGLTYPVFLFRRPVRVVPHTPAELTAAVES
jgi:membrane protein DedA with SNARE-associated domain